MREPRLLGRKFNQYEIVAKIGAGGMGEVYRARDTRLGREVAIKVLPATLVSDPERSARFAREARTLAALHHPNVASLFGFEEAEGVRFLVMELVEGRSLAQTLADGPLSLADALDVARQIAEGLEEAHERGIVHRDLKPANVMLTADGRVKILDFGLARAYQGEGVDESDLQNSPTITAAMTQAGTILGTAAYMSPEQARGRGVDRRADLWAFGVVLWEMLTAERLFEGETLSDTLAAVLRAEPDWKRLPAGTPENVRHLIVRCLERDPRKRLRDIGEARVRLERWRDDPQSLHLGTDRSESTAPRRTPRLRLPWAISAAAVATALFFALRSSSPTVVAPSFELDVHFDDLSTIRGNMGALAVLSPNGDRVAYRGEEGSMHVKQFADRRSRVLEGTENVRCLAFSPDGGWIAYADDASLKRVAFTGGRPIEVVEMGDSRGLDWLDDTHLVFSPNYLSGLSLVGLADGDVRALTNLDSTASERSHRWPHALPGGKQVLYQVQYLGRSYDQSDIYVVDVASGERTLVFRGGSYPRYLRSGHLVFARDQTLFAIPFDLQTLRTTGLAVPVLDHLSTLVIDQQNDDGSAQYDIADNGTLLYRRSGGPLRTQLGWLDFATGATTPLGEAGEFRQPRISPNGRLLAVNESRGGVVSIQLFEVETGVSSRFSFTGSSDFLGAWSPDSERLYWSRPKAGATDLVQLIRRAVDRSGEEEVLFEAEYFEPTSVSPDEQRVLLSAFRPTTNWDILELDLSSGTAHVFRGGPGSQRVGIYSPDGRWVVYSDGRVFERSLRIADSAHPQRNFSIQHQTEPSPSPTWSADSRSVALRHDGAFRRYPVASAGHAIALGEATVLQRENFFRWSDFSTSQVAPDLRRALVMIPTGSGTEGYAAETLVLVTDWFERLRARMPHTE